MESAVGVIVAIGPPGRPASMAALPLRRLSGQGPRGYPHALGAQLLLFEIIRLQSRLAGGRRAIADQRDIRGPQLLQQKPPRIARSRVKIPRARAQPKTIERRDCLRVIRADRHWRLAMSAKMLAQQSAQTLSGA